ncbi:hypothetical protein QTP88_010397 [Uroleucon formosanum]
MKKDDIIEPSFSPWNAPLLLVKKKLDARQIPKFRIVVDFRALNKVAINEYHPLPNITEILDQLGQCNLFSIIDLASGSYQIKLDEKSNELTVFSTNQGHWHFKKMVMGLKTYPCSFQRLMNNAMAGIVGIKRLAYLDDIIIYGKGLLDHNEKLRDVFERLRNRNLKIQPAKCEFLKQQCMYLGHIISENGIQPDPEKVKSVLQFPTSTSVQEIKSFLGLSGYYGKCIKSYSLISKPMTNLLRKDVTFNWDTSCQEAFDKLKNILCLEPILQYPDFTKTFIVTTDASGKALGVILSHGEVSQDLPIAYVSRTLSKCEKKNVSIDEQMIPFKGHLNIKQYMKGKPCSWGIKNFVMCGASGLMCNFILYQGKTTEFDQQFLKNLDWEEAHKIARENLIKRKIKSKDQYDKNENPIDIHIKDQILLRDRTQKNKLNSLWTGPYEVTDVLDKENIVIMRGKRHVKET